MRFNPRPVAVLVVAACMALPGSPGLPQQGLDFSGFYDLTDVADLGHQVSVTSTVEIFNHGAIDAYDATLTLKDPLQPEGGLGTIWLGFLGSRDRVLTSSGLNVPMWLYEAWQDGMSPMLCIEFVDAEGNEHRVMVDLTFMPLAVED